LYSENAYTGAFSELHIGLLKNTSLNKGRYFTVSWFTMPVCTDVPRDVLPSYSCE